MRERFARKGPVVTMESKTSSTSIREPEEAEFNERAQANQLRLAGELSHRMIFIVGGSGSSLSKSRLDKRHA
jgi:hypothetical protein